MFLFDVTRAFQKRKIPFSIVGGYAVALHGAVRGTVDLDIVLRLSKKHYLAAEKALNSIGLKSRLPVTAAEIFDFREEYIKNRNLIAWSFFHPQDPTRIVDIVITHDLSKLRVKRVQSGKQILPVLDVSDLIAMKRAGGRPQDLEDIRALQELQK